MQPEGIEAWVQVEAWNGVSQRYRVWFPIMPQVGQEFRYDTGRGIWGFGEIKSLTWKAKDDDPHVMELVVTVTE